MNEGRNAVIKDKAVLMQLLSGNHLQQKRILLSTVSGVITTTPDMIEMVDRDVSGIDIITTKSFQVNQNPGNREPVITEPKTGCFGNSVGLRNPGMDIALEELRQLRKRSPLRSLLNISVSASNPDDFITLVLAFGDLADIIELNFSCPHASAGYGSNIGERIDLVERYMRAVRDAAGDDFSAAIFPKLTPNVPDIGEIAQAAAEAGADGITAINTVGPELYLEPHSRMPILQNTLGGRGGMSGEWIRERALECVSAVRTAVGDAVPVIGMGGVTTGADAAAMVQAGADAVGIGSVFARVQQQDWTAYIDGIRADAAEALGISGNDRIHGSSKNRKGKSSRSGSADHLLTQERQMDYRPYTVRSLKFHSKDIFLLTLNGSCSYSAGEYVFLWLPGTGEKPFSIAESDPLTFIIKRKGVFTEAAAGLSAGDAVYVRGLYGAPAELTKRASAVLIAGGTGIAVLPALAGELREQGTAVSIFYGSSDDMETAPLQERLSRFGVFSAVPDDGKPGRVLDSVSAFLSEHASSWENPAVYAVGPEIFMKKAAEMSVQAGIGPEDIFLSLEKPSLCGIGMCGACSCGGRLTCQYGTFLRYDFLKEHADEFRADAAD